MKRKIKSIHKPFEEIVKAVARYNPNPDKELRPIKKYKKKKAKKKK